MNSDDPISRAISLLENAPNSPEALAILSELNRGLLPRERVCEGLVGALIQWHAAPNDPDVAARLVTAKLVYATLIQPLNSDLMASLEAEARRRALASEQGPPSIEQVLGEAFDDLELELGLGMSGPRGTWHRLWALLVMESLDGSSEFSADAIREVRSQLDRSVGRSLTEEEFEKLRARAEVRARRILETGSAR